MNPLVRAILACASAAALGGCPAGGGSSESTSESALATDDGSGAHAAAETAANTGPTAQPEPSGNGSGAAAAEVPRPPSLPSLMRRAGFDDASPANLDQFVHLPPGAEGQAGEFGRGEETVRVALIGYPNDRYVRPHVTDVEERIRVLPEPREAIIANGRWVIHIAAGDRDAAQALADRLAELLGWN